MGAYNGITSNDALFAVRDLDSVESGNLDDHTHYLIYNNFKMTSSPSAPYICGANVLKRKQAKTGISLSIQPSNFAPKIGKFDVLPKRITLNQSFPVDATESKERDNRVFIISNEIIKVAPPPSIAALLNEGRLQNAQLSSFAAKIGKSMLIVQCIHSL